VAKFNWLGESWTAGAVFGNFAVKIQQMLRTVHSLNKNFFTCKDQKGL
jgi:hypothetical protein